MQHHGKVLATLVAFALAQPAFAADRDRIPTSEERTALITYILPVATDAVVARCAPVLAPEGYLRTHATALLERMTARQEEAWLGARDALIAMAGPAERPTAAHPTDAQWRSAFEVSLTRSVRRLTDGDCRHIEAILAPLDPLPYDNLIQTLSAITTAALDHSPGKRRVSPKAAE